MQHLDINKNNDDFVTFLFTLIIILFFNCSPSETNLIGKLDKQES